MIPPMRSIFMPLITTWAFGGGARGKGGMSRRELGKVKQIQYGWFTSPWIPRIQTPSSQVCSKDGGKTWEDVDKGRLPNVPHHAVVIRPDETKTVYVANDAGVFVSHDSGNTWMNMTRNLPNVMVVDVVLQEKDSTLSAATYGRSLWRTRI